MIEGINRLTILLIIIGALTLIGDGAPYIHKAFPKKAKEIVLLENQYDNREISKDLYQLRRNELKEKYEVFGFTNMRRFLFAIGVALALFCAASIFFMSLLFTEHKVLKKAFLISSVSFLLNGLYYIIWVFWENKDLPELAYHLIIFTIAVLLTATFYYLYKYIANVAQTNKVLKGNLDTLDKDIEFIKEIGLLMPDDKNFITYKVLIDTTSTGIKETQQKIKEILGE